MEKYEISKIRRIRDYKILFNILSEYHARNFSFKNDKQEGASISCMVSKAKAKKMEEKLKESGLVFRVLE